MTASAKSDGPPTTKKSGPVRNISVPSIIIVCNFNYYCHHFKAGSYEETTVNKSMVKIVNSQVSKVLCYRKMKYNICDTHSSEKVLLNHSHQNNIYMMSMKVMTYHQ